MIIVYSKLPHLYLTRRSLSKKMVELTVNENTEIKFDIILPETYKQDDYCKIYISVKNDNFSYECSADNQFMLSDIICIYDIFDKTLTYNTANRSMYYDHDREYVFYDSDITIMTNLKEKAAYLAIRIDNNDYRIFIDTETIKSLHKYLKNELRYFV